MTPRSASQRGGARSKRRSKPSPKAPKASQASAPRATTRKIIAALERAYGRPWLGERKDPLSELIFTILSQSTTDLNRDRAWESLHREFSSWEEVTGAPRRRLERAIKVGGLAPTKSRVIREVLARVKDEEGSYSLDRLRDLSAEEVESHLRRFKGVGLKTIRCVQVFSLGQPAFPVDTHIYRITKRLGLVPAKASPEAAHEVMQALTPAPDVLPFHLNLSAHGRRVCKAGRPLCASCVLVRLCAHGRGAHPRGQTEKK